MGKFADKYKLIGLKYEGVISKEQEEELNRWIGESKENRQEYLQVLTLFNVSESMSEMKKINAIADLSRVKKRFNKPFGSRDLSRYLSGVASILVIPLLFLSIWLLVNDRAESSSVPVMCQYETAFGIRSRIELSDGTKVWLNSGSKIHYPDKFTKGRREVILEGEAFFEVHSDVSNPFYVDLGKLKVKATGTKFNIDNYTSEGKSSVYLAEGHVTVITDKDRSEVTLGKLKTGELMVYNHSGKEIVIRRAENEKYLGWLQGKLIFRNDYMDQVALRLGRWYNADIVVADQELNDFFFTATFRNESLEQAMDLLSRSSPIDYTIVPATQNIDGSFGMRKVIIRQKEND